jgi:cytochrome P450
MPAVLGVALAEPLGDDMHAALSVARRDHRTATDPTTGAVVALRYDDCEQLAHDRRIEGVGLRMFDLLGVGDGLLREWYGGLMFTTDGPHHDRLRRLVARAFTPRAVEELRVEVARVAADSLASVRADGGGDLGEALGLLPMQAMCRLLGVPPAELGGFAAWADTLSVVFGVMTPEQIAAAESTIGEMLASVDRLVDRRRHDPGDDLITALLAAEGDGGRLTHDEVVAMVTNLLVGGHDTTRGQLTCTFHTLLRHPDALERLAPERDLVPSAVNETIRMEPSLGFVPRTLTEPVVLDVEIPTGSLLLLCSASANRDVDRWERPDAFELDRFAEPGAPRVLTFGAGAHHCLGAALARLTVEEGVNAVLDLGPLRAAEDQDAVPWRMVLGRSPARVHVELA